MTFAFLYVILQQKERQKIMKIKRLVWLILFFWGVMSEVYAEGLPANPWGNRTATQVGPKIAVHYDSASTADYTASLPVQNVPKRNAGGVGKISAPVQIKKSVTVQSADDATSAFSNFFSDDKEEPKTATRENTENSYEMPQMDMDIDSEYEKLKRQSMNKWNSATAPLRGLYAKWRKALQETSEMNLKDFMP